MNKNRTAQLRNILCLVLAGSYIVGLVCMFLNAFPIGVALWVVSTVGGLAMLYHIRSKEEKEAAAREAEKNEDGDDEACE